MVKEIADEKKLSDLERIKKESRFLRGTIADTLLDPITGAISEDDNKLLKFHGSYQQDDRDLRNERLKQKLEPAYQFMVRARIAGGIISPDQWLALDQLTRQYANGTLRVTTRQTFQFHGILKRNLKQSMQSIHEAMLTTIAACGDVNRNVMCNPNPYQSEIHEEVYEWAKKISDHLLPKTKAYHEIWLNGEKVADSLTDQDEEPLYGRTYLPRKFKIGVAVPPSNDVDIYSQDLGFIAVIQEGELKGFNVVVGGGMGMTYGDPNTYPQVGKLAGFCSKSQVLQVAENIAAIQRDYGNRSDRKYARFKYTIDRYGMEWFLGELENRLGYRLENAKNFRFDHNGDRYGWVRGSDGNWHYTLFIQSGRIQDFDDYPLMTGLREIAKIHQGDFRLTPNQNVIIGGISSEMKPKIEQLMQQYGLTDGTHHSALRRNSIACVALPTCGLAMAEAERYLPELLHKIELILEEEGLLQHEIVIRMSGCPNGCARPALAEIAFTGKAPGKYNLYLGGSFTGNRLNKLYRENIGEAEILESLQPIIHQFAVDRLEGEHFGDFVVRQGYVKEVLDGRQYHD